MAVVVVEGVVELVLTSTGLPPHSAVPALPVPVSASAAVVVSTAAAIAPAVY